MSRYTCEGPRALRSGITIRCGHCVPCLRLKAAYWAQRATCETIAVPRTWAVTLTYAGDYAPGYREVQLFLKRCRKAASVPIRYLCAAEVGSVGGRRHYHLLVHTDLRRRDLDTHWPHGFAHLRLVRSAHSAGTYAAKYSTKVGLGIKASVAYGTKPLREFVACSPVALAVRDAFPNASVSEFRTHRGAVRFFGKTQRTLADFNKPAALSTRARFEYLTDPAALALHRSQLAEAYEGGGPLWRPSEENGGSLVHR